jgi:hypothetical protein
LFKLLAKWTFAVVLVASFSMLSCQSASAMDIFSQGMQTPETISLVPAGAYGGLYDGKYFVPDPGRISGNPTQSTIWIVGPGPVPEIFSPTTQPLNAATVGGLFLPNDAYWGTNAGKYLTVGWNGSVNDPNHTSTINVYDADGTYSTLWSILGGAPKTPVIAPGNWGAYGGQLIVADGGPDVYAINNLGVQTSIVTSPIDPITERFGLAFAPEGWGSVGGSLLASRATDGKIFAVDAFGNESVFTKLSLAAGTHGLRHLAFGPAGFIPGFEELLFASVSGSSYGGGTLGDVLAIDAQGRIVASLKTTLGLDKFDPRGLYFTSDGKLLISDAADPIWLATASDFQSVPEPGTLLLLSFGLIGFAGIRRKIRN